MTSVELKWFYNKLREAKDAEEEAREEAIKQAENARKLAQQINK